MISRVHPQFRRALERLPRDIQRRARHAYRRFRQDPSHPALGFKPLHTSLPRWSVWISEFYRAVGVRKSDDEMVWFFIGTHADYERLIAAL